jgi:uncharacterized protein YbjT (DUF2867 family)
MKKSILWLFAAILICGLTVTSLSSCKSDSKDDSDTNTYGMGFSKVNGDLTEMATIDNAFRNAVGAVNGVKFTGLGENEFIYAGDPSNIVAACKTAEASLANEAIKGIFVYQVFKRNASKTVIYTYQVNTPE